MSVASIKRSLTVLFMLALVGCHHPAVFVASPKDEVDVIATYLQKHYSYVPAVAPLVIEDTFEDHSQADYKKTLVSEASDAVPIELINDFCSHKTNSQVVWAGLESRLQVKLIGRAEEKSLFSVPKDTRPDGWDRFYTKYPKSPGIITLSRVGFNRRGDIAMLYEGSQSHWLAGSGRIHVFRKQAGKWVEESIFIGPMWVS